MERRIYVNGFILPEEQAFLPAPDRGFLYGYGLFETFLVKQGRVIFIEEHLERLWQSAPQIGLVPPGKDLLMTGMKEVITQNKLDKGSLRLSVSAGPEGNNKPSVVITFKKGLAYRPEHYRQGFKAGFINTPRNERSPLVYVKSLNYLENILGRQETLAKGWNEGLFLNTQGLLTEGTVSNIFLVTGDKELVTPEVKSGLLPGIMRAKVMEAARTAGYRCVERAVQPAELLTARECFLTNSLMKVMPLVEIEGRPVGEGISGEITEKINELFNKM